MQIARARSRPSAVPGVGPEVRFQRGRIRQPPSSPACPTPSVLAGIRPVHRLSRPPDGADRRRRADRDAYFRVTSGAAVARPILCVCILRIGLTDKLGSVFEHVHKNEIKRAKDEGIMTQAQLDTIIHPNEYFKRSFLLKQMGGGIKQQPQDSDVKMEG